MSAQSREREAWMLEFTDPQTGERDYALWRTEPKDYDLKPGDTVTRLVPAGGASDPSLLHGDARYEYLRRLNPRQFRELWERNLRGENFDDMVDMAIDAIVARWRSA